MNNRFPYPNDRNIPRRSWDNGTGFLSFTHPGGCQMNPQQEQFQSRINYGAKVTAMQPSGLYKDTYLNHNDNRSIAIMSMNHQFNMMSQTNNQQNLAQNQQMIAQNHQMIGQNYHQILNQHQQMMLQNSPQMMGQNNQQMMYNQCNRMPVTFQNNCSNSQFLNNSFTQGIRPLMSLMLPRGPIQLQNYIQGNKNQQKFINTEQGCSRNSLPFQNQQSQNSWRMTSSHFGRTNDVARKQATNCISGRYRSRTKWTDTDPENVESKHSNSSYSEELKVESVVTHKRQVTRSRSCGDGHKDWQGTDKETVTVQTKETIVTRTPVHTVFEYNHNRPSRDIPSSFDASCHYSSETVELTDHEMATKEVADGRYMQCGVDGSGKCSQSPRSENDYQHIVEEQVEIDSRSKDESHRDISIELDETDSLRETSERMDQKLKVDYMPELKETEQRFCGYEDYETTAASLHHKQDEGEAKSVGIIDGKYVFDQDEYNRKRSQQAKGTIVKQRNEKERYRSLRLRDEAWNNILKNTMSKSFEDFSTESDSEAMMLDSCTHDTEVRNTQLKSILKKTAAIDCEDKNDNKVARWLQLRDEAQKCILENTLSNVFEDSSTETASEADVCKNALEVKKTGSESILKKSITTHCEKDRYSVTQTSDETDSQLSPHSVRCLRSAVKGSNSKSEKDERMQNRRTRSSENVEYSHSVDLSTGKPNSPYIPPRSNSVYKTLLEMDQRRLGVKSARQILDKGYCTMTSPENFASSKNKGHGSIPISNTDINYDRPRFQDDTNKVQGSIKPEDETCIPGMEHYVFSPPSNPPSRHTSPHSSRGETSDKTMKNLVPNMKSSKSAGSGRRKNNQSVKSPSTSPKGPPKFWSTDYLNFTRKAKSNQKEIEERWSKTDLPISKRMKPTRKWSKSERCAKLKTLEPKKINPSGKGKSQIPVSSKENYGMISSIRPVNAAPKVTAGEDNIPVIKLHEISASGHLQDSGSRSKTPLSPCTFYGKQTDTSTRIVIQDNCQSTKITRISSIGQSVDQVRPSDKRAKHHEPSKSNAVLGDKKLTITLIRGKKYSSDHPSKDNSRSIMSPVSRRTNVRTCILAGRKSSSQTSSAQKPGSLVCNVRKTRSLDSSPYDAKLMKDVRVRVEDLNLSKLTQARVPRICLGDRFAAQQKSIETVSTSKVDTKLSDDKKKGHQDFSKEEEDCLNGQKESLKAFSQCLDECTDIEDVDMEKNSLIQTQEIEILVKPKRGRPPGNKNGQRRKRAAKTKESLSSRFSSNEFESQNKHEKNYGRPLGSKNKGVKDSSSLSTRRMSRSLRSGDKSNGQAVEMTVCEETQSFSISKDNTPDDQFSMPPKGCFDKQKVKPFKIALSETKDADSRNNVTPLKISIVGLRNSKKEAINSRSVPSLKMILLRKGLANDQVPVKNIQDKQVVTPLKISGSSVTKMTIKPLKLCLKPSKLIDKSSDSVDDKDSTTESETEATSRTFMSCENKDKNSKTTAVRKEEVESQNSDIGTESRPTFAFKTLSESQDVETQMEVSMSSNGKKEDLSTNTRNKTVDILENQSLCGPSDEMTMAERPVLSLDGAIAPGQLMTDAGQDALDAKEKQVENSAVIKLLKTAPSSGDSDNMQNPSQDDVHEDESMMKDESIDNEDNLEIASEHGRDEHGTDCSHLSKVSKTDESIKHNSSDDDHNPGSSSGDTDFRHSKKRKSISRSSNDQIGNIGAINDEVDVVSKKAKTDGEEDGNEVLKESTVQDYSSDNAEHEIEYDSGLDTSSFNRSEDSVERNIFEALIIAANKDDDLVQEIRKRHLRSRSDSHVANSVSQESRRSPRKRKSSDEVESLRLQKRISKEKKREMSAKERQRFKNFQTNLSMMSKNVNIRGEKSLNKEITCKGLWRKKNTTSQRSNYAVVKSRSKQQKMTHAGSESSDTTPRKLKGSESDNGMRLRNFSSKGINTESTFRSGDKSDSLTKKLARKTSHRKDEIKTKRKNSTSTSSRQVGSKSQRRDSTDTSTKGNNSDSDAGLRRSRITFNMIKGDQLPSTNLKRRTCLYCRSFSTRLDHIMKEHVKLMHPHKCAFCKMAFKDEVEAKAHRLTRHVHEVHHCLLCRKVFTTHFHYKKHVRSKAHLQLLQVQKDTLDSICRVFSQDESQDSFSATLKKIQNQEAQLWNVGQRNNGRKALPAPGDTQSSCVQAPNLSHLKHFYYDNPDLESVVRQIKDFVNAQNMGLRTRPVQELQDCQGEHFFFALPNVEDTESWTVTSESETELSTRVTSVGNPDILEKSLSEVLGIVLSENSAQAPPSCLSEASCASLTSNRSQSSTKPLIIDTGTESSYFSDVDGHSGQFLSLLSDDALSYEDESSVYQGSPGGDLQEFLIPLQVPQLSLKSVGAEGPPVNAFESGGISVLPKPLTLPSSEPADGKDSQPLVLDCTKLDGDIPKGSFNENDLKLELPHSDLPTVAQSLFTSKTQDKCLELLNTRTESEVRKPQCTVVSCNNDEVDTSQKLTGKDNRIKVSSYKGCTQIETTETVSVEDLIQCQPGYRVVLKDHEGQAHEVAAENEVNQDGGHSVCDVFESAECGDLNLNDGARTIGEMKNVDTTDEVHHLAEAGVPSLSDEEHYNGREKIVDKTVLKDLDFENKTLNKNTILDSTVDLNGKSQNEEFKITDGASNNDEKVVDKTVNQTGEICDSAEDEILNRNDETSDNGSDKIVGKIESQDLESNNKDQNQNTILDQTVDVNGKALIEESKTDKKGENTEPKSQLNVGVNVKASSIRKEEDKNSEDKAMTEYLEFEPKTKAEDVILVRKESEDSVTIPYIEETAMDTTVFEHSDCYWKPEIVEDTPESENNERVFVSEQTEIPDGKENTFHQDIKVDEGQTHEYGCEKIQLQVGNDSDQLSCGTVNVSKDRVKEEIDCVVEAEIASVSNNKSDGIGVGSLTEEKRDLSEEKQFENDHEVKEFEELRKDKCSVSSCHSEGSQTEKFVPETEVDIDSEQTQNSKGSSIVVSDSESFNKETSSCDLKTYQPQYPAEALNFESDKDIAVPNKDINSVTSGTVRTSCDSRPVVEINKSTYSTSGKERTFVSRPVKTRDRVYSAQNLALCQPNLSEGESLEAFPETRATETQLKDEVEDMFKELSKTDHAEESPSTEENPSGSGATSSVLS